MKTTIKKAFERMAGSPLHIVSKLGGFFVRTPSGGIGPFGKITEAYNAWKVLK